MSNDHNNDFLLFGIKDIETVHYFGKSGSAFVDQISLHKQTTLMCHWLQSEPMTEQRAQYTTCKPWVREEIFQTTSQVIQYVPYNCHIRLPFAGQEVGSSLLPYWVYGIGPYPNTHHDQGSMCTLPLPEFTYLNVFLISIYWPHCWTLTNNVVGMHLTWAWNMCTCRHTKKTEPMSWVCTRQLIGFYMKTRMPSWVENVETFSTCMLRLRSVVSHHTQILYITADSTNLIGCDGYWTVPLLDGEDGQTFSKLGRRLIQLWALSNVFVSSLFLHSHECFKFKVYSSHTSFERGS